MTRSDRHDDGPTRSGPGDWTQVEQRYFDPEEGDLTTDIVFAVAAAEGVPPSELRTPLYEAVDAAALESTFFHRAGERARQSTGTVDFRYAGYRVAVRSDGWIRVYESVE